jgi:hypothetical protein
MDWTKFKKLKILWGLIEVRMVKSLMFTKLAGFLGVKNLKNGQFSIKNMDLKGRTSNSNIESFVT